MQKTEFDSHSMIHTRVR